MENGIEGDCPRFPALGPLYCEHLLGEVHLCPSCCQRVLQSILRTASDARKENISELGYCIDKHRKPHKVFNYLSAIAGGEFK